MYWGFSPEWEGLKASWKSAQRQPKKAALPQLPEHFAGSSTEELPLSQQLRLGYITLRREGLHESCQFP